MTKLVTAADSSLLSFEDSGNCQRLTALLRMEKEEEEGGGDLRMNFSHLLLPQNWDLSALEEEEAVSQMAMGVWNVRRDH